MKTTIMTVLIILMLPLTSLHASGDVKTADYHTNFYQAVNKAWLEKNTIPADKVEVNSFSQIDDKVKEQSETLIREMLKQKNPNAEVKMISYWYTITAHQDAAYLVLYRLTY